MYYRPTADGRIVLGGGRLEHLEDEYTADERATAPVQAQLDRSWPTSLGWSVSPSRIAGQGSWASRPT